MNAQCKMPSSGQGNGEAGIPENGFSEARKRCRVAGGWSVPFFRKWCPGDRNGRGRRREEYGARSEEVSAVAMQFGRHWIRAAQRSVDSRREMPADQK